MDKHLRGALVLLVLLLLISLGGVAWARSADGTAVDWSVMSGGGAPAASGSGTTVLNGTLGQAAIGHVAGGGQGLGAGFWYGASGQYRVYLPLVVRNH